MKLSHYTKQPLATVLFAGQVEGLKPRGLWVSVDGEDDWPAWCHAEGFHLDALKLHYRVELAESHNVLVLGDPLAVRVFGERFRTSGARFGESIDWARVGAEHDGLIIAPYQWSLRLAPEMLWYYGWDCASGCIWNPRAISSVSLALTDEVPA